MKNLLVIVALLAACGPKTPVAPMPVAAPEPVETQAAPVVADAAFLPPAFAPETLRQGLKVGTVIRYQMSANFQEGTWVEEWSITAADDSGCTIHTRKFGPDGTTVIEEEDHTQTWSELSGHGTYLKATTTRTDSSLDVAGQHLATVYYEQIGIDEAGTNVKTHFAPVYVGPPVWTEMSIGEEVIFSMQMLSYTAPP